MSSASSSLFSFSSPFVFPKGGNSNEGHPKEEDEEDEKTLADYLFFGVAFVFLQIFSVRFSADGKEIVAGGTGGYDGVGKIVGA